MRFVSSTSSALVTRSVMLGFMTAAAIAQPDIPAVTKPFTVFAGDARGQVVTTPITYFGGMNQGDSLSRTFTLFGGMNQGDGNTREFTIERGSCSDSSLAPVITLQPVTTGVCAIIDGALFDVQATGIGRITYLWEIENYPGHWETLSRVPLELPCGGAARIADGQATSIIVTPCIAQSAYRVRCTVANACGGITSAPATLFIAENASFAWNHLPTGPSPRLFAASATDSTRGRTVLHGGAVGPGIGNDETWEFDGTDWMLMASGGPGALHGTAMADLGDGRVILSGGYSFGSSTFNGGTWVWDGTQWRHLAIPGPSARFLSAMTFDPIRRRVVLFGGTSSPTSDLDDTWEFNPATNTWTQLAISGPSPRNGAQLAFDPMTGQLVLFGGARLDGAFDLGDTWVFNGTAWTMVPYQNSIHPLSRANYAMVTDTGHQRIIMHGGRGRHPFPTIQTFADAWEWDGVQQQWTQVPSGVGNPPILYGSSSAESPLGYPMIIGGSTPPIRDEAYRWDGPGRAVIVRQPAIEFDFSTALVHIGVLGSGIVSYQWHRNGVPLTLEQYPTSQRATLAIDSPTIQQSGEYHCIITDACGSIASNGIVLIACPADYNQDGGIDGADVETFFADWTSGAAAADVNQDGGVDGADVEVFFAAWENGGC